MYAFHQKKISSGETSNMRTTHKKGRAPKAIPEFITSLPGEIRNLIFEYCITTALNTPKTKKCHGHRSIIHHYNGAIVPSKTSFTMTALPLWSGPSQIRMNSIGCLPLLFVSRQIYTELSSLLYSKVSELSLGGYMLQFPFEDPTLRWNRIYPLLKNRVGLNHSVKSIKIHLPSPREDLSKGYWRSLGIFKPPAFPIPDPPSNSSFSKAWTIIPSLATYLRTFSALEDLQIVITMDKPHVPENFEELLPLWDLCREKTVVTILSPTHPGFVGWTLQWHADWERAWEFCLISSGRVGEEKAFLVHSK